MVTHISHILGRQNDRNSRKNLAWERTEEGNPYISQLFITNQKRPASCAFLSHTNTISEWKGGKTKNELDFHYKETWYKDNPIYQDSYLDTCQDNWQLGRLKRRYDKENFYKRYF